MAGDDAREATEMPAARVNQNEPMDTTENETHAGHNLLPTLVEEASLMEEFSTDTAESENGCLENSPTERGPSVLKTSSAVNKVQDSVHVNGDCVGNSLLDQPSKTVASYSVQNNGHRQDAAENGSMTPSPERVGISNESGAGSGPSETESKKAADQRRNRWSAGSSIARMCDRHCFRVAFNPMNL